MKKQLAILGSTGSIGTQTLEVVAEYPDLFEVYTLTANNNVDLLIEQAKHFNPDSVVIANEAHYNKLKEALKDFPIKIYAGENAISEIVEAAPIDIVVTAMVGYSGLKPTIRAIEAHKTIALANKETLVVAGDLIKRLALEYRTPIIPVDSEHSAIFQCLVGEGDNPIEKIILTASGGPFRKFTAEQMAHVTKSDALKHPKWHMGHDRSQMAVRRIPSKHRNCRTPAICRALYGSIQRWICQSSTGNPRYETPHSIRPVLSCSFGKLGSEIDTRTILRTHIRVSRFRTIPFVTICI